MARFNRKGNSRYYFLPTIAATSLIPTTTEIAAGTDWTKQINAVEGFTISNTSIETPDMASTFVGKIEGDDTADDSSWTLYEDDIVDDAEVELAKGTTGYVVIFSKGYEAGSKGMDVFPVRVSSNSKAYTTGNEAAMVRVQFVITDRPLQNGTVPTGA